MSAKTTSKASRKRRILLVDDHAIVREGFAEVIKTHADLTVCGEAESAADAMTAVEKLKPDLVVVDLSLQGGSGLDLIKNLKSLHPMLPMLVLSMHDEALYAERALRAGALGYVMKRQDSATLLRAIREVLDGRIFLSAPMREQMLQKVVGGSRPMPGSDTVKFTDREIEVLQLIGEGRTTRQIAQKLHLSISTVETHRAHIKQKLNVGNGPELIRAAVEWVQSH
jgi:DNA-binding NarL/FixJ family response regulator